MKWTSIAGIIILFVFMGLFEWPKINPDQKKEKVAFVVLSVMAGGLSVMVIIYPDVPGPTEILQFIFQPLGKILEE